MAVFESVRCGSSPQACAKQSRRPLNDAHWWAICSTSVTVAQQTSNLFVRVQIPCVAPINIYEVYMEIYKGDCLELMKNIPDGSVDLVLTDIPYGECNRKDNGLRNLDKENADIETFDLQLFLQEVNRISKSTIIVFCGQHQFSDIKNFFQYEQDKGKGTVRQLIWRKTNPSPMNGQHIYLSGIENAVWFKKRGGVFNAHCKNTVFDYPCGRSKLHPTEKNHELLKELIFDNSNEGNIVFDPCMGSGSHGIVAVENNRRFIGIELDDGYFEIAKKRIEEAQERVNT